MALRFTNQDPAHRPHGPGAILRWGVTDRLRGRRRRQPPGPPAPAVAPDLELVRSGAGSWILWLGHASFLGSLDGRAFLVDPVLANHAGRLYRRHLPPALTVSQLPAPVAAMVTHNHYDHLDRALIRALPASVEVVVPAGIGRWMRRHGRSRVTELGWWESTEVDGLRVTLVPSRHWSRRRVLDTNRSLWGGFVVEGGGRSVYHAGDTAFFAGFSEIGRRFPRLEAALLPIGGYEPGWFMEHHHMTPEQAGRAFLDLGARRLVPMHWGTFQLTDEPLAEPAERMASWWRREGPGDGRRLELLAVGEALRLEEG